MASLSERLNALDAELGRLGDTTAAERHEAGRTRRGTTRANRRAEQAHGRLDNVEGRVSTIEDRAGALEKASATFLDRLTTFATMFRAQRTDTARHEERISHLETRADDDGNIVGVWLGTLATVEVFILVAWLVMAGWHNGLNQRLEDTPSYDSVFIWLSIGSAVVISVVAFIVWALADHRSSTVQHQRVDTSDYRYDALEAQAFMQTRGATQEYPVVR